VPLACIIGRSIWLNPGPPLTIQTLAQFTCSRSHLGAILPEPITAISFLVISYPARYNVYATDSEVPDVAAISSTMRVKPALM
jgi:hypothetical protein